MKPEELEELACVIERIEALGETDAEVLREKGRSYGSSWCRYGGVSAFMNLARKWDRLVHAVQGEYKYDIFAAAAADTRNEPILEDIRDLRRYLFLVEERITTLELVEEAETTHD